MLNYFLENREDKKEFGMIENGTIEEQGGEVRAFVEKYNWDDIVGEFEGVLGERHL